MSEQAETPAPPSALTQTPTNARNGYMHVGARRGGAWPAVGTILSVIVLLVSGSTPVPALVPPPPPGICDWIPDWPGCPR